MVGYNVQAAVDTTHHLIVAHEVINEGNDRSQLSAMSKKAKAALETDALEVVADRGYFNGEEILACDEGCESRMALIAAASFIEFRQRWR